MLSLPEIFILYAITPQGFIMLSALILFLEFKIAKSIIGDANLAKMKTALGQVKHYSATLSPIPFIKERISGMFPEKRQVMVAEVLINDAAR